MAPTNSVPSKPPGPVAPQNKFSTTIRIGTLEVRKSQTNYFAPFFGCFRCSRVDAGVRQSRDILLQSPNQFHISEPRNSPRLYLTSYPMDWVAEVSQLCAPGATRFALCSLCHKKVRVFKGRGFGKRGPFRKKILATNVAF